MVIKWDLTTQWNLHLDRLIIQMEKGQAIYDKNPNLQPLQQVAQVAKPQPLQQSDENS